MNPGDRQYLIDQACHETFWGAFGREDLSRVKEHLAHGDSACTIESCRWCRLTVREIRQRFDRLRDCYELMAMGRG